MKSNKRLYIFLFYHLLIFSTYNFGHPVTPQFIKDINAPAYTSGILLAMMALAQFSFAPLWGQISDLLGRKVAFLGPLGYAFGQLGFIFLTDAKYLLIFRFIAGAFASASNAIHYAYISDICKDKKDSSKYLGIAALMLPLGTFLGFAIGGQLGDYLGARNTFVVQAVFSASNGIILYFVMEGRITIKNKFSQIKWNIYKENIIVFKKYYQTNLKYLLALTFMNMFAFTLIGSQASVILNSGFTKTMSYIGTFIALYNLIASILSYYTQRRLLSNIQEESKTIKLISLFMLFSSLVTLSTIFIGPIAMWVGLMITTLFNTINNGIIQTLLAKTATNNEKGSLVGLNHSFSSLAGFFASLIGGFALSSWIFLPFTLAFICYAFIYLINKFYITIKLEKQTI